MLMDLQSRAATTAERSLDQATVGRRSFEQDSLIATGTATDRVVLKRGSKMMVLFRGCPCPTVAGDLRQAGVAIGLALSSGELPTVRGLDGYNYVFTSLRRRGRSTLAEAVADLARNSWSIDDTPA
jgi:hypothetical protein